MAKFSLNKAREEFLSQSIDYPGPGQYEPDTNKPNPKHKFHTMVNGSSSFISAVPKFPHESPRSETEALRGPGYYDAAGQWPKPRHCKDKHSLDVSAQVKRSLESPGPGHYDTAKCALGKRSCKAPFNSSQKRQAEYGAGLDLGPGKYIDINNPIHSSMSKHLLKNAVDREIRMAHGISALPFGSTGKRFHRGYFAPKDGPGPGQYSPTNSNKAAERQIFGGTSSSFLGTSKRFDEGKKAEANEDYSDVVQVEERVVLKQTRSPYYPFFNGKNIAFDSTQSRFKESKKSNPGPGQYFADMDKMERKANPGFNRTEEKYKENTNSYLHISSTNESVGPGSYSVEDGIAKKSFNVNAHVSKSN